ncbi:hypothetical protein KIN20_010427 [Parelaphostrongylus tenuis]|uniref:Uncharacterized protein n=1 Tax=Parelaphostrongylus tenuis TaxID=148309 RepID=A0AAD5QIT1_PARTN|nr:hypothetical protein KIN20_010427 [Parelaphostrongylus tenuis]
MSDYCQLGELFTLIVPFEFVNPKPFLVECRKKKEVRNVNRRPAELWAHYISMCSKERDEIIISVPTQATTATPINAITEISLPPQPEYPA